MQLHQPSKHFVFTLTLLNILTPDTSVDAADGVDVAQPSQPAAAPHPIIHSLGLAIYFTRDLCLCPYPVCNLYVSILHLLNL